MRADHAERGGVAGAADAARAGAASGNCRRWTGFPETRPVLVIEYPFTHHKVTLSVYRAEAGPAVSGPGCEWHPIAGLRRCRWLRPIAGRWRRCCSSKRIFRRITKSRYLLWPGTDFQTDPRPFNFAICADGWCPIMLMNPPQVADPHMSTISLGTVPDATGHFGPYGGMFVPETLMTALHELTAEYERARKDNAFPTELDYLLRDFAGRPTPLYFAERLTEKLRRREDLSQARGPAPHRRAQDQQCARPDPARAADGQEADHRRDRRRPARRGDGDGGGAVRASSAWSTWARWIWSGRR